MDEIRKLIEAAKDAKEDLETWHERWTQGNDGGLKSLSCDGCSTCEVLDALRAAIPAAEAELAGMGWVPVSERLPEDGVEVLVRGWGAKRKHYVFTFAERFTKPGVSGWEDSRELIAPRMMFDPVDWMPLPAPPSEPEEKL